MTKGEVAVRVGGAAGDGVASTGETLALTLARTGLHVTTYQSYQSVIRGGHIWFQIRGANNKIQSQGDTFDVLLTLDQQTLDIHTSTVAQGGAIVYDPGRFKLKPEALPPGVTAVPVPTQEFSMKASGKPLMSNTASLGAVMFLLGVPLEALGAAIEKQFGKKDPKVIEQNIQVAQIGYDHARANHRVLDLGLQANGQPRMVMSGNQAICLGALAAGCKFVAQYPMTPASSIMHWMAKHAAKYGVVLKQAEDEIAALNMVIGASFAGARAMTATSGGGYSLMVEATGLAGMTETPAVIIECMRAGPSTGLPTKTEQGDLNMVLGASQGDFPRIVLAPRNPEEAFEATWRAFNFAEVYQCPVFVLSDLYLSEMWRTAEPPNLEVPIVRGMMANGGQGQYNRYRITETGVSPRALPGQEGLAFTAGSDEHNEHGELISDVLAGIPEHVRMRAQMMEKRMRKLQYAAQEMRPPELWGPREAAITIISWGSSQAAVREAVEPLGREGIRANSLEYCDLWPFPTEASKRILGSAKKIMTVEGNYTGQFTRLLRAETGIEVKDKLLKYDGEPFYPSEIAAKAREVVKRAV